ncbi:MAG: zinc metallopeptidase [Planctomycetota bacterium]|nr:MAG: zinc metallopeptidase [Planctomycetota bacterium]
MIFFDPLYLILISPALLLAFWAQARVKWAYERGMRIPAGLSGAAAARHILDRAGCHDVGIELSGGWLSDHYDPRHRVLRLSPDVYHRNSATAVGIAAHEAGHALQHAQKYAPLVVRNAAVPAAAFGSNASIFLLIFGALFHAPSLVLFGLLSFAAVVVFQLVNLPVEFDASRRAKQLLTQLQIVDGEGAAAVSSVLNAAAWTYVAATLQSILTLLYYVLRFGWMLSQNDE